MGSIYGFFRIYPNDSNIPQGLQKVLAGKTFATINYKEDDSGWGGRLYSCRLFSKELRNGCEISLFPIELFNITVGSEEEHFPIQGNLDAGTFYVAEVDAGVLNVCLSKSDWDALYYA